MSVKVKICGIRTMEAAQIAIDTGADFLGFNFVETSKRYINPADAKKIINLVKNKSLPTASSGVSQRDKFVSSVHPRSKLRGILAQNKVKVVGVFQDADLSYVNKIAANLGLDFVQLHGNEDNKYISQLNLPVIKSITINNQPQKIHAKYFLLDRPGRKGEMVNVEKAAQLATQFPIFFAGGLDPDNVARVIKKIHPFAVDIAGGVETKGVQDSNKIKLFIKNSREVT